MAPLLFERVVCNFYYYLNLAPTITYGLKRFAFKARFMILILTI